MPKERQTSTKKAARYAEYKQLEEEKLFAGVKKLISFDFGSPYGHHNAEDHYDQTHKSQIATSPTINCMEAVFISCFHQ